jgi:hypothetical protein
VCVHQNDVQHIVEQNRSETKLQLNYSRRAEEEKSEEKGWNLPSMIWSCPNLKSSIFWDTAPCSPLKVNQHLGRTYLLHLQGRRISWARNQRESRLQAEPHAFTLVSFQLILRPWRWRLYVPPKCWLIFNGLQGVIFQKTDLFINIVVRTSDPTCPNLFFLLLFNIIFVSQFVTKFFSSRRM